MNRDEGIALMLELEGGEANLKGDPGGHTKYGITQRTLDALRPILDTDNPLPANVGDLTPDQAAAVYRNVQWVHIRGNDLAPPLAALMLNAAVNMGEPEAIKLLQASVGVEPDGAFGSRTLSAVESWVSSYGHGQTLAEEYAAHVAKHYAELNAAEGQFELGWFRRLWRVYTLAACQSSRGPST